jgi:hypothetical protein
MLETLIGTTAQESMQATYTLEEDYETPCDEDLFFLPTFSNLVNEDNDATLLRPLPQRTNFHTENMVLTDCISPEPSAEQAGALHQEELTSLDIKETPSLFQTQEGQRYLTHNPLREIHGAAFKRVGDVENAPRQNFLDGSVPLQGKSPFKEPLGDHGVLQLKHLATPNLQKEPSFSSSRDLHKQLTCNDLSSRSFQTLETPSVDPSPALPFGQELNSSHQLHSQAPSTDFSVISPPTMQDSSASFAQPFKSLSTQVMQQLTPFLSPSHAGDVYLERDNQTFYLTLEPASLGKIEVTLSFQETGLELFFRGGEMALDFLQADQGSLLQKLNHEGISMEAEKLSFEGFGHNGHPSSKEDSSKGREDHAHFFVPPFLKQHSPLYPQGLLKGGIFV